jgi:AcrR family transcriptional regulator
VGEPAKAMRAEYLGPARRRGPVLDAALTIFADGGFEAASMVAIADGAGVTKPVLYDCFPGGKQELWFALLEREEEAFLEHMAGVFTRASGHGLERGLSEGLDGFLEYAEVRPGSFRVIFGRAGSALPEVAQRTEQVRERIVAFMAGRLAASGRLKVPESVGELYVRAVVAVAEELARWTLRRPDLDRRAMVQLLVLWFMQGFDRLVPAVESAD